jgi:probable F420-dependent oxidoreductase
MRLDESRVGPIGLWAFLDQRPAGHAIEVVQEIESLGYAALWLPEAAGRDALVSSTLFLDATERLVVATGIVPLYARDPMALNSAWLTLEEAFPERFILGIGVSHQPMVEGVRGATYGPPLATMRSYLERMEAGLYLAPRPETTPRRVLAALGPKMLALAAEKADGAHPYNVTPEHTKMAREVLGDDKLLAVEQKAVLTMDLDEARQVAREMLSIYLGLPNYVNNWRRLGFTDDDFTDGGSDRFLDAMVVSGNEGAIRQRVHEHLEAGADHVCVQVLPVKRGAVPLDEWRLLAPALLSES